MVGHPRSPVDIVVRSAAIHVFAVIAYANLLYLLPALTRGRFPFSKSHDSTPKHASLLLAYTKLFPWLEAFADLPAFLLTHLGLRLLLPLVLRQETFSTLFSLDQPFSLLDALPSVLIAVLCALPLNNAFAGYRTRFAMRYHEAIYVGNLGLDHRNGWIAVAGLLTTCLTIAVALVRATARNDNEAGQEDDKRWEEKTQGSEEGSENTSTWRDNMSVWWESWEPLAEAGLAALIQQPLLLRTNHIAPLGALGTVWPLLLVSAGVGWLLHRRRGGRGVIAARVVVGAFVLATVVLQAGWDGLEFASVLQGRVRPYNYRWAVRDDFSARVGDD